MMEGSNVIFNLNRRPFRDFDSAARMRDLLIKESGNFYRVERHTGINEDDEGFAVVRDNQQEVLLTAQMNSEEASSIETESSAAISSSDDVHEYRPALRSYLMYFSLFFACLFLLVFSYETWSLVLSMIGVNVSSGVIDMGLLVQITQAFAAAILLLNGISLLYRYYSVLLVVDGDGVSLRKGIVAREFISIRFSEIKTVGIKQGFLARLLNVGNLEFASSGSDGVDIIFNNVVNPGATKDFINNQVKNAV